MGEEEDHGRECRDGDREHQDAVVSRIAGGQAGDEQGHRLAILTLHDDQRPQIVVPCAHEGDDGGGGEGRCHDGHIDSKEDAEFTQPVYACSLHRLDGEGLTALAEEENQKGLQDAKLYLLMAAKQVLANGLDLLGLSAPTKM